MSEVAEKKRTHKMLIKQLRCARMPYMSHLNKCSLTNHITYCRNIQNKRIKFSIPFYQTILVFGTVLFRKTNTRQLFINEIRDEMNRQLYQ